MAKLIFELSVPGRCGHKISPATHPHEQIVKNIPSNLLRKTTPSLPEISEGDVVRHYTHLSTLNFGVDTGYYPLGSCTMKYNPKINEDMAKLKNFSQIHPLAPESSVQGTLEMLYLMEQYLAEIFGYARFSLQPLAGAHGEYTGLMIMRKYFEVNKQLNRKIILIPDSAHGTNPASAAMAGFDVKTVPSAADGGVDLEALKKMLNDNIAGFMLTNPSTLGLFEKNILEISKLIHNAGGLMYYDGANSNALLGLVRPGDMGFDVAHINLHKTFSTPHGGGGPGSGPVGVSKKLADFLPKPTIEFKNGKYTLNNDLPDSIGKISTFYGNIGVIIKAFTYILTLGREGLKEVTENAIINANYLMTKIGKDFDIAFKRYCMHEFVISAKSEKAKSGVKALDIAKRLIDFGFHPPTIYFPLIVSECLMIEPTETESKESLDEFIAAMHKIAEEIKTNPQALFDAPQNSYVKRLDETKAVKEPKLIYKG